MLRKLNLLTIAVASVQAQEATAEECLANTASIWDEAAVTCTPCEEGTVADEAGTACVAPTEEAPTEEAPTEETTEEAPTEETTEEAPTEETTEEETVKDTTCDCLGTEANGLPPASLFTEKGMIETYGSTCGVVWDEQDAGCLEGGEYFGQEFCTSEWCYVSAECQNSIDTLFFAETEYAETLKWSMETCSADTTQEDDNSSEEQSDPECDCLETEENGLPPASLFTDKGMADNYGSTCGVIWDENDEGCLDGGDYFGQEFCTSQWCYVSAKCGHAKDTLFFAETEYAETLKWSMQTCKAKSSNEGSACPENQKADPTGKCRDLVKEDMIRTNLKMDGDFASFDQEAFQKEMAAALGVSDITIIEAYEGSIVVVYEVSTDEISLEDLVDKFANGDMVLSYPVIDVSSETADESINVIKGGEVTNAARMKADNFERDTKVYLIFFILGIAFVMMIVFAVFICLRQISLFNQYKEKHHMELVTPDSARTDKSEKTDTEK